MKSKSQMKREKIQTRPIDIKKSTHRLCAYLCKLYKPTKESQKRSMLLWKHNKKLQQEYEFDRAFEFIIHELRRMEIMGYALEIQEDFTYEYLKKIEETYLRNTE